MCPKDFITGRREDQALTPKNAALLLRRDQSLCVKCLDWDRPVTEVWSLRATHLGKANVVVKNLETAPNGKKFLL